MNVLRTKKEIESQLGKAQDWTYKNATDVPGMTYEQGVQAALEWALNETDAEPIENDFSE
jgi:hypothetical protein